MYDKVSNRFHPLFLLIIFYGLLAVVQSYEDCGTCIENEKLADLIDKFDMFQAEMKTEIKGLKSSNVELKTENVELTAKLNQFKLENEALKNQVSKQGEQILVLKKEIQNPKPFDSPQPTDSCTKKEGNAVSKKNEKSSSRALDLMPTSCDGLRKKGHFADGIYLVLNDVANKIEAVFCQFLGAKQVSQALIGRVEVKTNIAHFYVQKNISFGDGGQSGVIPFELARLNEGDAFDLPSGTFTAPVSGIYHFDFSAVKEYIARYLDIAFQVNGVAIGRAFTGYTSTGNAIYASDNQDVVSMSVSLRLAAGDRINLYQNGGYGLLSENIDSHKTHFTGWLVEEDLM